VPFFRLVIPAKAGIQSVKFPSKKQKNILDTGIRYDESKENKVQLPFLGSKQGGTRPLPPLGRRSALHPGSFSLHAQRKGTKRNAPQSASADFFAGGRTNSRPSTSYGADRTGPAPLPAKNSSHNASRGIRTNQNQEGFCTLRYKISPTEPHILLTP